MKLKNHLFDKFAIGFAILCFLHCLLLPITVIFSPLLLDSYIEHDYVHWAMLIVVLPISWLAFKTNTHHRVRRAWRLVILGFVFLVIAVMKFLPWHSLTYETILTILGSGFVLMGHVLNLRYCRDCQHHHMDESKAEPISN